jgi:hypothetical protein
LLARVALALGALGALVWVAPRVTRRGLGEAVILGAYLLLAVSYTGLWNDLGTRFLAGNDPVQDVWVLNTVTRNLLERPGSLFEGNLFYPAHNAVLFADPLLGLALFLVPLRLLNDNPVLLYNGGLLLGLALASYGFYRLGIRLCGDPGAALLAGIAVALHGPADAPRSARPPLALTIAGFPFLLLELLELLDRPRPPRRCSQTVAWQAGSDGYYAFTRVDVSRCGMGLAHSATGGRAYAGLAPPSASSRSCRTCVAELKSVWTCRGASTGPGPHGPGQEPVPRLAVVAQLLAGTNPSKRAPTTVSV